MIISPYGAFLRIIVDLDSCRLVSSRAAPVRCRFKALDVEGLRLTQPPLQRRFVVKVLREASNEGTLHALAMLTVSQLSKSFAGRALFDDVSLQVNRGDRIVEVEGDGGTGDLQEDVGQKSDSSSKIVLT